MSGPEVSEIDRLLRRLRGRRSLARLTLLFELVWPGLWPAIGVAGLFACLAMAGILRVLPPWAHLALLAVACVAFLGLLIRGLRRLRVPDDVAADRRLEEASGLRHRPLAALTDQPARRGPDLDPAQEALWQAHVSRVVRQVRRLRVGFPHPGLAGRDRRALRGALAVALVAAVVIAGSDAPARLAEALSPGLPIGPAAPEAQLQVWITSPPYTGQAPLFLKPGSGSLSVPSGAHVTASLTGGDGEAPSLVLNGRAEQFRALDGASFQGDIDLDDGGRLAVKRDSRELAGWDVAVVANQAPVIAWTEPPGRAARGLQTRLPWQASDAYGVVQLQAELRLDARPAASPLVVTIPVPGGTTKSARAVMQQDLTSHPWAGLPVTARLVGRDAAGMSGSSADARFSLPERSFRNPLARALIEVRKGLSLDPEDRVEALERLDRVLGVPDALAADPGSYLNLADIYYRLVHDRSSGAVAQAQAQMWELALHLEDGGAERTARALEAAREAAREALERATREPTVANRTELDRKLTELEAAIREHMDALMEQARREGAETPYDPDAQHLDSRDLSQAAEAAREAARRGQMDEAKQRMAELEQMLEQLQNARPEHGPADARSAEKRQRGQQEMGALQDMIGRQGRLLDRAQGRATQDQGRATQDQRGERMPGSREPGPSDAKGRNAAGQADGHEDDRRVQQALRRALGELMQEFGDLTGNVPQSLGDADQAMRDAGQALGQGQDGAAGKAEQRAIEALQKGGQQMGQQMAKQFGRSQSGQGDEGEASGETGLSLQDGRGDRDGATEGMPPGERGGKRDPLGRQLGQGSAGSDDSDSVRVPEEMERQRTRIIQDELRRRGAERSRPQPELDYIGRLLKQF